MIRAAGAQLVVFPELSLTGYELDAEVVSPQDEELGEIVAACTDTESVALVGAPIEGEDGTAHIGMLRASSAVSRSPTARPFSEATSPPASRRATDLW